MTTPTNAIPPALLEAATAAIFEHKGYGLAQLKGHPKIYSSFWDDCQREAQAALEAAGVPEILSKDRIKTKEINLLVRENKEQAKRIAELEAALDNLLAATEWLPGIPGTATYNPAFIQARKAQTGANGGR